MEQSSRLVLWNIAMKLGLQDILRYCQSNSRINRVVCQDPIFWRTKIYNDFGFKYNDNDVKILQQKYNKINKLSVNKRLIRASKEGQLDAVIKSIEYGADIHTENDQALRLASKYGHLDVVKYLVEQGANIHALNDAALMLASKYGHLDVVKYLVEQGVDIHALGDSALRWASYNGHLDVVKYLKSLP